MIQLIQPVVYNFKALGIAQPLFGHRVAGVGQDGLNRVDLRLVFLHTSLHGIDGQRSNQVLYGADRVQCRVADSVVYVLYQVPHKGKPGGNGLRGVGQSAQVDFTGGLVDRFESLCRFF